MPFGSTTLLTASGPYRRARLTNQTSGSFVSKVPTTTKPVTVDSATGAYIIQEAPDPMQVQNGLVIVPYAIGSNGNTFSVRVIGWRDTVGSATKVWIPTVLTELLCTLDSTITGVASAEVLNTELFCSTIAVTYGTADVPALTAGLVGHAVVDRKGFPLIELSFKVVTATSANALYVGL